MTVPMEGLTNRQARAVIAEDEDRARAVLAEQRAVYGDPDKEAAAIVGAEPQRRQAVERSKVGMVVGHARLTCAELDALIGVLERVLERGRHWPWRDNWHREKVRRVLGKLRGVDC